DPQVNAVARTTSSWSGRVTGRSSPSAASTSSTRIRTTYAPRLSGPTSADPLGSAERARRPGGRERTAPLGEGSELRPSSCSPARGQEPIGCTGNEEAGYLEFAVAIQEVTFEKRRPLSE